MNTQPTRNLERDIQTSDYIKSKVQDYDYARRLYHSLCNTRWLPMEFLPLLRQDPKRDFWSCSWRYAGGLVANIQGIGDYMDWYCSGKEGMIDPEIAADLKELGWIGMNDDDEWV